MTEKARFKIENSRPAKREMLLAHLHENPFVLAPMAGITDCAFRSFMREQGCSIVVSELVSATGLKFSSERTRRLMRFEADQHPVGIQLFGEDLSHLAEAAKQVEDMGADFVDLNFGCPVPKVTKKGAGSAVLKDLGHLRDVVRGVRSAIGIPLTIKIRTGWDQNTRNSKAVVDIAHDEGVTWVAIHGRTRAAGYSGQADWDYIAEVRQGAKLPVLGNGDLNSAEIAVQRLRDSKCAGVLIGRGCLKNPWIFLEAKALWEGESAPQAERDFLALFRRLRGHLEKVYEPRLQLLQLKKFAAWYSAGYPGSGQFRKALFQSADDSQIEDLIHGFFIKCSAVSPEDTSHEPFLMGGHG